MPSQWRDVAVFLDGSPAGAAIGRHAARLAQRHKAHLVGVYGVSRDDEGHDAERYARGTQAIKDVMDRRRAADEQKILAAGRFLGELSREYGIGSEFRVVWSDGPKDDTPLRALHCDLIVSAQPQPAGLPPHWSAERLLLITGIPVLLIPEGWTGEALGENVLIAWNRSREARRAVGDALPFIGAAGRVTVLVIDGDRNPEHFGESPGANLVDHLSRHDAKVELASISSHGAPIAEVILGQAKERGADLLVIGAYSHPRTSELLFGGVTRSLLSGANVPMLISR
ncbi:universal stress protein [Verticiella sediminum]|uniref:Universal stress protein n=1 Tax=Verticiella sediminum TaxID=1247510 RepID=A0A556ALV3_9BURK|nr:universal stress protein [Verticiella sediminum]TSH93868.1 universal stress protein [Verticiella sediminum]